MSIPVSSSTAAPAIPAVSGHSHGGHKKGGSLESLFDSSSTSSTDSTSSTAAQLPVGSTQNLFGNLLSSLEQVIGIQPPQISQSGAVQSPGSTQTPSAPLTTIGSRISLTA
jgi:hypothetical protein